MSRAFCRLINVVPLINRIYVFYTHVSNNYITVIPQHLKILTYCEILSTCQVYGLGCDELSNIMWSHLSIFAFIAYALQGSGECLFSPRSFTVSGLRFTFSLFFFFFWRGGAWYKDAISLFCMWPSAFFNAIC